MPLDTTPLDTTPHNTTPSQQHTITLQHHHNKHHHVTRPSQHNTIASQHHHNKRTLPQHFAIFTKTTIRTLQQNVTTTQHHHNKTKKPNFFLSFFILLLHHLSYTTRITLVSQSRLAFSHHHRASWPQAFVPLPIAIQTHHSFACPWWLWFPAVIESFVWNPHSMLDRKALCWQLRVILHHHSILHHWHHPPWLRYCRVCHMSYVMCHV